MLGIIPTFKPISPKRSLIQWLTLVDGHGLSGKIPLNSLKACRVIFCERGVNSPRTHNSVNLSKCILENVHHLKNRKHEVFLYPAQSNFLRHFHLNLKVPRAGRRPWNRERRAFSIFEEAWPEPHEFVSYQLKEVTNWSVPFLSRFCNDEESNIWSILGMRDLNTNGSIKQPAAHRDEVRGPSPSK